GGGPPIGVTHDAFAFSRLTGTNALVSHAMGSPTSGGRGDSAIWGVSANGRFVTISAPWNVFTSYSFPPPDGVCVFDQVTGVMVMASHAEAGPTWPGNTVGHFGSASADGRFVAFQSAANNMPAGASGSTGAVYVFDRDTGAVTLVSHIPGSATTNASGSSD